MESAGPSAEHGGGAVLHGFRFTTMEVSVGAGCADGSLGHNVSGGACMERVARMMAGAVALCGAGCVSLEKYDELQMSHRTVVAEKEQVEQELYDCRNVTDNLRSKVTALEGELETKTELVANLQGENDRLDRAFQSCQTSLEALAGKPLPETAILERTVLPEPLDTALKQFAAQYPSMVEYDAQHGMVKWKADLVFPLGSAVVMDSAKEALAGFAKIVDSPDAAEFDVIVVGHTDNVPIKRDATRQLHPTNWHLSAHRAIAVSDMLQEDGMDPTRVGVMGYGEFRPLVSNDSEENRSMNRRVAIYIVPKESIVSTAAARIPARDAAVATAMP